MEKKNGIKQKIIDTTKDLLKTQGQVTIKDIAETSYINIAAVNYHFGSKENLITIVLKDIIETLKAKVTEAIHRISKDASPIDTLTEMLDIIYTYAIDHIGIINYLFLQHQTQNTTSSLVIQEFFKDSPFTHLVLSKLSEVTHIKDEEVLKAKYMVLFSSFSIPLFIQVLDEQSIHSNILSLKDPSFKDKYLKELIRLFQ
ncbi:MAG: TetR/AcrR family transcriptional regulator [Bacillota bacterium]